MPRSVELQKKRAANNWQQKAGRFRESAGQSCCDRSLTASTLVLRAEEPRPRIADHVAPLVVQRLMRPIAARTGDRNGRPIGGISDVARINRIGRIGRVRNRVADDGAGSEATENAEPDAAATAARRGVARSGHRSKRK